jgi:hypothetical protein
VSEFRADQTVQGDFRLGSLDYELAVNLRRNPNLELPTVPTGYQQLWNGLARLRHILDNLPHCFDNAMKGVFLTAPRRHAPNYGHAPTK